MTTSGTIVWIVELREELECDGCGLRQIPDCTVMHIASSREKAEAWIKLHPNASSSEEEWHWWIGRDQVDAESIAWDHQWLTYSPDGTRHSDENPNWETV